MDEPFTGVDAATQEATLALLDELRAQQVTVMLSTHDLNLAATRFDRVLLLNRHLIGYGSPQQVFTAQAITEAFGGQVLFLNPQGASSQENGLTGIIVPDQGSPSTKALPAGKR
jgi:ABC-type Mn2+/Zn2+ transport system ATPase subunit